MSGGRKQAGKGGNIIIRKEEVVEGGHHGGAWKVAYADFVTAMMAFFLLMWLLNATTADKRRGLADYFSPNNLLARTNSGFGAPFGGRTPNVDGDLVSDRGLTQVSMTEAAPTMDIEDGDGSVRPVLRTGPADTGTLGDAPTGSAFSGTAAAGTASSGTTPSGTRQPGPADRPAPDPRDVASAQERAAEKAAFERAAQQLKQAVAADPALADVGRQLTIDITPQGLRVQMLDEDRQPMFATGSATVNDRARLLLQKVAPVLMKLPEPVAIDGHTDAAPFRGGDRTNWDLSADRANATRRLLTEAGLPESRLRSVTGHADRDPLLPGEPLAAANRRIAITVLRGAAPAPVPAPIPAPIPVPAPTPVPGH